MSYFMTVTYELQDRLKPEQYRALGQFANTYGLQRFRFDEEDQPPAFRLRRVALARNGGRARPARRQNSGAAAGYASLKVPNGPRRNARCHSTNISA